MILLSGQSVLTRVQALFGGQKTARRRVMCVAFIGQEAPRLLPNFQGVEVYCWPQPGATDPHALEALQRLGASIHLVDRMHMKLYWAEGAGFVLTSANLSASAMRDGGNHEIGWFESDWRKVDISTLLESFSGSVPLDVKLLEKLYQQHDAYWRAHPEVLTLKKHTALRSFSEWYEGSRAQKWKMSWWDDEEAEAAPSTLKEITEQTGEVSYESFMDCMSDQLHSGDWLLTYQVKGHEVKKIEWMYVDLVHTLSKREKGEWEYPCQAVQLKKIRGKVRPPFECRSKAFKEAFTAALHACYKPMDGDWETLVPKNAFMKKLAQLMKS